MIFCIGLPKTGTSSMSNALNMLGINCLHDYKITERHMMTNNRIGLKPLSGLDSRYQAFADYPIDINFRQLDYQYSDSLFIATHRDLKTWLISRQNHADRYGIEFDEMRDIDFYNSHYTLIDNYFKKSKQLLHFNMFLGDGWNKLCGVLNKPIPNESFPWVNRHD